MSLIRTTQVADAADFINFGIGQPGISLLPLEILREAAAHRLGQKDPALLQYGTEYGDGYFRLALADFLTSGYGIPVEAEYLFITASASQALDMICSLFTHPGDVIFVEEPSYFLALRIFVDHQLKLISLPVDEHGLVLEALEEKLKEFDPVFLYTIPTFQNPTGVTLSASRKNRLADMSQEHGFYIVADEVYQLLNYTTVPPAPMASYLGGETVLSLGSFSKILAPGLRLGWIQAAPVLLDRLAGSGLLESGGGLNPFTSGIVRSVLEQGWQTQHLAFLKATYKERSMALSKALHQAIPEIISFNEPEGGFFIWLKLPPAVDTNRILTAARKENVGFQPGVNFSSSDGLGNCMRLSFAYYETPVLEEGVKRLGRVLEQAVVE